MDLITNKDLFISSEIGISFDALLSNAYIHFKEEQETIEELFLFLHLFALSLPTRMIFSVQ